MTSLSKRIGVHVEGEWSDTAHRYDRGGLSRTAFDLLLPLVESAVRGDRAVEIAADISARTLDLYRDKLAAQVEAFQQAMLTEALDQAFNEWRPELHRLGATPKSVQNVGKEMKRLRHDILTSRHTYVWGAQRAGRPKKGDAERSTQCAIERVRVLHESVEIVRHLRSTGERYVTHTDVARKMFAGLQNFKDMRSSYSRVLKECGLRFDDVLRASAQKVLTENCAQLIVNS